MRVVAPSLTFGEAPAHVPRGRSDRTIDLGLVALTVAACLVVIITIAAIIFKVVDGASSAISTFGLGFLGHLTWNTGADPAVLGGAAFIYGTLVTSAIALLIAGPIGIAIGLFLALLAPARLAAVIGPLVELLAAIPSVVLGLWAVIFLTPIMRSSIEPALHDVLGWIPIFGTANPAGTGIFTAGLVLTIMVVPIMASISRELFRSVPSELKDGALALGCTRWEMVRGVVLGSTGAGLTATAILGVSRAMGEAIAVTSVIGDSARIPTSLFDNGDTIGSRIAAEVINTTSPLWQSGIFYLAAILLVIELVINLAAQLIVRRYSLAQAGTR